MSNVLKTVDGTDWDCNGEYIQVLHINEQWPLWLSREDLEKMIERLKAEPAFKGVELPDSPTSSQFGYDLKPNHEIM